MQAAPRRRRVFPRAWHVGICRRAPPTARAASARGADAEYARALLDAAHAALYNSLCRDPRDVLTCAVAASVLERLERGA